VPKGLDWDFWLGPAPFRPFNEVYYPGPKWYRWWDFGNGTMSDLGSHWNDMPFWALKLDHPQTVEGHGPPPHPEITPANMRATWTYGQRGDLAPVTHHWYQEQSQDAP
jgi:predicted dehydrogenase